MSNKDKAGENYWSTLWGTHKLPDPIRTKGFNPNIYVNKRMHEYFKKIFSRIDTSGKLMLEIGCANSVWLPYFAKEYDMNVTGIDYSEYGCQQSKQILERDDVIGKVLCVDFFNPPQNLLNKFDFVFSLGVAEHFEDTVQVLKIFSRFLKPGGIIITQIPNMTSLEGKFHKWLNRKVYDIHNILDKEKIVHAHEKAGLTLIDSRYLISISFYVNLMNDGRKVKFFFLKKPFVYFLSSVTKIVWFIENFIGSLPTSKLFSPIIFVTAIKK